MKRSILGGVGRASVVIFLLGLPSEALAGSVRAVLLQEGRDVSSTIDARVVFSPLPGTDGPPIACVPFESCPIPKGRYAIALNSPTHVALDRPTFVSDTEPAEVPHPFALRVFPAGLVELARGRFPDGAVLTVLDVESGLPFKGLIGKDRTSVRSPARKVVAGVFRDGKILEQWKPVSPREGQRLELPDSPPLARGRGQLVVSLLFPASGTSGGNRSLTVRWRSRNEVVPPDLVVTGDPWRWTGFWFDLPAGEGVLDLESRGWALAGPAVVPVPDRGVGFQKELNVIPRPRLEARFEQSLRLPAGDAQVDLLDCRRLKGQTGPPAFSLCTPVSSLRRGTGEDFRFEGLDPVLHGLRWEAGPFRGRHLVDLSDGQSQVVAIPIAIHLVRGQVTRGGRPAPSTQMTWRHFATEIETVVATDDEGRYEVLLAPPGQFVVFVDGPDFRRHAETVDVTEDREAVFNVPANITRARVVDAESGLPIPGALVAWHLEPRADTRLERGESVRCDDTGNAQLPPFPPGQVIVTANARGYRASDEQKLEITKASAATDLEFRLAKGVETRVRLVDENGNPATGAWAQLPSGARTRPADDTGFTYFEVVIRPGDPVFVASISGSVVLARFIGEEATIRIDLPSHPFTVRFLAAGGRPAAQEALQYSIDGIQVPQPMDYIARRAAGGDVTSRSDGTLTVAGLPSSGTVSLWPFRKPDAAVTRPLPVSETVELVVP